MVKYWVYYPRNFGNGYSVIRTESVIEENDLFNWYNNLKSDSSGRSLDRVTLRALNHICAADMCATDWEVQSAGEFLCLMF